MRKISAGKFHFEPPSHHSITSSARPSSESGKVTPSASARAEHDDQRRGVHDRHRGLFCAIFFPTRRVMISRSDFSAAFKISNCSGLLWFTAVAS
jgi:hypothetical protein